MNLVVSVRPVSGDFPDGTRSVSVFLVNDRPPVTDPKRRDEGYVFQAQLCVSGPKAFVPRPDVRGQVLDEWDERVADIQYRSDVEYAVGHNVSTIAVLGPEGDCSEVQTTWIPTAKVEKVDPARLDGVDLGMEALAGAATPAKVREMVGGLVEQYGDWIKRQAADVPNDGRPREVAQEMLKDAERARSRITDGLRLLDDAKVFEAFKLANRVMAVAARQRGVHDKPDLDPASLKPPAWRVFQLAFVLMNLRGISDPAHQDREAVDLLFFPTGGGKTEAYLGLAAFTLVYRRLTHPGVESAGVSVLMRYTLRLLTLDQLGRAATLICALELERQDDKDKLGSWPFEIGLWVGQAATPNRMGKKGDKGTQYTARGRTLAFQNEDRRKPSPIPLETCPWCGWKFRSSSFQLLPDPDKPTDLRVICANRKCSFNRNNPLPLIAVDEPLYRRLPCFVIATVDKFAGLPFVGQTGALFGLVDRHDQEGFYGPCDPGRGSPLPGGRLPPPALIIQDELHLISGPLGTMAGLYETAIDHLATVRVDGKPIRPKIVASTATVRRATKQIRALFGRGRVDVFPPPGLDRRDSFFAKTVRPDKRNPRLYVGVAAQGRSLKVVLLRTYLALMAAAQRAWNDEGGAKNPDNPADPYMTMLGYFGSLRELGGTRRIIEDEVTSQLRKRSRRRREGVEIGPFGDREIGYEPVELTSRVPTNAVSEAKRRLALPFHDKKDRVDVALATNMISVGLDIVRLGLMVVLGQPKTAAEYIQATSRVGRDEQRPGLVIALLNLHRPRDRSHYERFEFWHETFYRSVEATSVTPFSPRTLDRGLAGVSVALARHGDPHMTPPTRALDMMSKRSDMDFVGDVLSRRAEAHDLDLPAGDKEELRKNVRGRVNDLLDVWEKLAAAQNKELTGLQYGTEANIGPHLLWDPIDPDLLNQPVEAQLFKAQRSLRDVEPSTNLWIRNPIGYELDEDR